MTDKEYKEIAERKQKADLIVKRINDIKEAIKHYKSIIKNFNDDYQKSTLFDCEIKSGGGRNMCKIKLECSTILGILQSELLKLETQLATQQKMFEYL